MKILFTFPGQGSQYAGMLHQLPNHPLPKDYLQQVSDILNENVLNLDSQESLAETQLVQLCLLITSIIHAYILINENIIPDVVLHGSAIVLRKLNTISLII